MFALTALGDAPERPLVDSTHQGAPDRGEPAVKGDTRRIGRAKGGGLNSKLDAVYDEHGRFIVSLLADGQTNDHAGARQ